MQVRVSGQERDDSALDCALYVDSPVLFALRQIHPFYRSGIFDATTMPVFLRRRPHVLAQRPLVALPAGVDLRWIGRKSEARLPIRHGGVQIYPFNSNSNMSAVANRRVVHVLTLHGESNKVASYRPAARLYDYVTVAGPLGRDRYLAAGIFSPAEIDRGRIILMGDSFVQSLPWLRPANAATGGRECTHSAEVVMLYCPTWEGFGAGAENYSSVQGALGFDIAARAARTLGSAQVLIKPHPYTGMLRPAILVDFLVGLGRLRAAGLDVRVLVGECNPVLRGAIRLRFPSIRQVDEGSAAVPAVALGLSDVSGMQAIFLKHRVPNMVISPLSDEPIELGKSQSLRRVYDLDKVAVRVSEYLDSAGDLDRDLRKRVFGWQEPQLARASDPKRRDWLITYLQGDPYWTAVQKEF